MEPARPVPPRTIQTRTQTALEQGIPRRRFSHFGYPSDSDSEPTAAEPPNPHPTPQLVIPEVDDLEPLFSDQEKIQPETLAKSLIPSPSGTSAPLLSNPSLTDTLNNFPLIESSEQEPLALPGQSQNAGAEQESQNSDTLPPPVPPSIRSERGRTRGRPPGPEITAPPSLIEAGRHPGNHQ